MFEESVVTALALGRENILFPTLAMKQRFHKWSLSLYEDYFKIPSLSSEEQTIDEVINDVKSLLQR